MTQPTQATSPSPLSTQDNQSTTPTQLESESHVTHPHHGILDQDQVITPRTNLYASDEGWTLVASLPDADQDQALLETEGAVLKLSVPHQQKGIYQRFIRFPRETTWGSIKARWEGYLLYVDLSKDTPIKRMIEIS